jgi:hypothetical protein
MVSLKNSRRDQQRGEQVQFVRLKEMLKVDDDVDAVVAAGHVERVR